jgi:uncharacterized protein YceK
MNKSVFILRKILLAMALILAIAGCASVDTVKIPTQVPEIHPGILCRV